ncbi:MAG: flagellar hook-associated protein FlgK [Methyloligellaceae bacterium]
MGLASVLNNANSGLAITQSSLEVVARNVANADTPGYTKKTHDQSNLILGADSHGVRSLGVSREVDIFLQAKMRLEVSAFSSADIKHEFLSRIDQLFGSPGNANALDTIVNAFSESLQQLTTTPESFATREGVIGDAQVLTQQLRLLSGEIQGMRQQAEAGLAAAVADLNESLGQLAKINQQLSLSASTSTPNADLMDERDKFIDRIAELIEVNVIEQPDGSASVFTKSGNALLEGLPAELVFDERGDITAQSVYSANAADRGVGTIKLLGSNGFEIDLIQNGILDSGKIGAFIELRDTTLVQAQAQLDELAHGLALAFANKDVAGTAVTVGAQQGFDVDTTGLQPGNPITLSFTTTPPGVQQNVTIIRVDDPTQLPLSNDLTPDPNDTVIGVDFSGGIAAAAATIDAALGGGVTVSAPGGGVLQFLDDGAANTINIDSLSATVTATSAQDDGLQLPLFVDGLGGGVYSASLDGGSQKTGFAGRITLNSQIVQNNELLVRYNSSPQTPLGDTARPLELLARLDERSFAFSPSSGIGEVSGPFSGSITSFTQRVIDFQAGQASEAERAKTAQDIVVSALRDKFVSDTGVDINQELSDLINLQNAFAANARVVQVVDELMRLLVQL